MHSILLKLCRFLLDNKVQQGSWMMSPKTPLPMLIQIPMLIRSTVASSSVSPRPALNQITTAVAETPSFAQMLVESGLLHFCDFSLATIVG